MGLDHKHSREERDRVEHSIVSLLGLTFTTSVPIYE